jgi:hypothetical protein
MLIEKEYLISLTSVLFCLYKNDSLKPRANNYYFCLLEVYHCVCYDLFGNVQWEFAHDKMKGPNGITCGENGELYVLCFKSNNLFMLDTEGKHGEEVLNKLVTPINVYYDKHTQRLIIITVIYISFWCCCTSKKKHSDI